MTDDQISEIILSDLRQKSPRSLINDILAPKQLWNKHEEHRIKNIIALLTDSNKISVIGGDKYFPATDIELKIASGTDKRKEILLYLLNSGETITDLRPLIKSLAMTRKEITDTFSVLESDEIVQSDRQWRQFNIISAGVEKTIDEVPFNFRLTPKGEHLVLTRYQQQPIIQNGFIGNVIGDYVHGNIINTGNNATIQYQHGTINSNQTIMKQSEKLDLILKGLYEHKYDGKYYSLTRILNKYGVQTSYDEVFSLGKKLESDGNIKFSGQHNDVMGCLTTQGIMYVEGESYTYQGKSIINNNYNISIVNSPNSNIVNQSENVNITQNIESIQKIINQIKETAQQDKTIDPKILKDILDCLNEIEQSVKNGGKPKFAIKSLTNIAGSISSISSWVTTLGQFAGIIPPLPI